MQKPQVLASFTFTAQSFHGTKVAIHGCDQGFEDPSPLHDPRNRPPRGSPLVYRRSNPRNERRPCAPPFRRKEGGSASCTRTRFRSRGAGLNGTRPGMILKVCWKIQGFPSAPRAIMTPSHPVFSRILMARWGENTSPLPMTGTNSLDLIRAIRPQSETPEKPWVTKRG